MPKYFFSVIRLLSRLVSGGFGLVRGWNLLVSGREVPKEGAYVMKG